MKRVIPVLPLIGCLMQPMPGHAQSISPRLVNIYAALGAIVMAKDYMEKGDQVKACQSVRNSVELSAAAGSVSPQSIRARDLMCN
jgi:hypothetical protein